MYIMPAEDGGKRGSRVTINNADVNNMLY